MIHEAFLKRQTDLKKNRGEESVADYSYAFPNTGRCVYNEV